MLKKQINDLKFLAWRIVKGRKYDKAADKYRGEILDIINKYVENNYIYIGFGTVLKLYRDGTCKGQDLDIIVSRKFYESMDFKKLILELKLVIWRKYFVEDQVAIEKFLYKDECPVEFFVADFIDGKEIIYDVSAKITQYKLTVPTIEIKDYSGQKYPLPQEKLKYIEDIYGEGWSKKISSWSYGKSVAVKPMTKHARFVEKQSKIIQN